jgi:pimeloyl-ACP methyl ester carboxylesterase
MASVYDIPVPEIIEFTGASGNRLVADRRGALSARPVLLAHGGGQTRHAWRGTADRLADRGWCAITIDQRGHGESDWIEDGAYEFEHYAEDIAVVADEIAVLTGRRPVAIGASLGGFAAMLAQGGTERRLFEALVLVDITPTVDMSGVEKILGFMAAHVEQGFGSLDEAADAIAAYLPHRKRPRDLAGLTKNLTLCDDGRYRWHWDPRFLHGRYPIAEHHVAYRERNVAAAKALSLPVLLVRGGQSELVSEEHARAFMEFVPHADYADVSGAGHMVAGDRNDVFTDAVIGFLGKL